MTQSNNCFPNRPPARLTSLPCLISLSLSIFLLSCSSPSTLPPTEAHAQQPSIAEIPHSSNMIDLPETDSELAVEPELEREPIAEPEDISSLAQQLPLTAMTTINGTTINLEVANTPRQQAIGLMYRTSLRDDQGMLFPFSPPRPVHFWMRNVEINLDMVFIQDGTVLAIEANVPPCRTAICPQYGPAEAAVDYVLELRGGRATELGVEVGDPIVITELPNAL